MIRVKQGDTLRLMGNWPDSARPTLSMYVRTLGGRKVAEMTYSDNAGDYDYQFHADTSDWPLGQLVTDMRLTFGVGDIRHSRETLHIQVERPVTEDRDGDD